ncbi:MAG: nucleoside triphosphate pyrophosphohydrolase [Proteobacteria bacterium]|nr:nucleoside triphosphate pyrophosphohydrolase [Pseudomonadota bacterium]
MDELLKIMARLRDPERGCPWDVEQTFATIAPYTIEEAYEVAQAIDAGDMEELKGELGDLLFQVVFHARMAEEAGHFDFEEVVKSVAEKMIRRHPHVWGEAQVDSAAAQTAAWEDHKAAERAADPKSDQASLLDDVPLALPALLRAEKLQKRAARGGFDWPEVGPVVTKIKEEIAELSEALAERSGSDKVAEELGDLLFAVVNLARHIDVAPEEALRRSNQKFGRRFRHIEAALAASGRKMGEMSLDQLEALWQEAKKQDPS